MVLHSIKHIFLCCWEIFNIFLTERHKITLTSKSNIALLDSSKKRIKFQINAIVADLQVRLNLVFVVSVGHRLLTTARNGKLVSLGRDLHFKLVVER